MKLPILAAAALLAGTSAFAFAPSPDAQDPAAAGPAIEKPLVKDVILAKQARTEALAASDEAPALQQAAMTTWNDDDAQAGNPDLDLAVDPNAVDQEAAPVDTADAETADTVEVADPVDAEAADTGEADAGTEGVGGPIETADAAAATAPRPAAHNYPACSPGPGDDNCIQLYEPGVEVALASWTQPTGGLAQPGEATMMASAEPADETATGVGGPYEPVEAGYSGDGSVDSALGETAEAEANGAPEAIY